MTTKACCFTTNECFDLTEQECIDAGGLPSPDGFNCAGLGLPGTVVCGDGACCIPIGLEDPVSDCINGTVAECELHSGATHFGRGTHCSNLGGIVGSDPPVYPMCDLSGFRTACCLPDGTKNLLIFTQLCEDIGGVPIAPTEPCETQADEECRLPEPDRVPTAGLRWTLDVCANTPVVPVIRQSAHSPRQTHEGYFELMTTLPCRPNDDFEKNSNGELCQTLYTQMALNDHYYAEPHLCSNQSFQGDRAHHSITTLQTNEGRLGTTPGYGLFVSTTLTPLWTEAVYYSGMIRCELPFP